MKHFRFILFIIASLYFAFLELSCFNKLVQFAWTLTSDDYYHVLIAVSLLLPFMLYGIVTTFPFTFIADIAPEDESQKIYFNAFILIELVALSCSAAEIFIRNTEDTPFLKITSLVYMLLLSLKSYEIAKVALPLGSSAQSKM